MNAQQSLDNLLHAYERKDSEGIRVAAQDLRGWLDKKHQTPVMTPDDFYMLAMMAEVYADRY